MNEQSRQEAERIRQEAEDERNRREELRRIGEGGPEQHIPGNILPGRVEAEAQRVAAEVRRSDLRKFYVKITTAVALPLAFIALIPAVVGLYFLDREVKNRTSANRKVINNQTELIRENIRIRRELVTGLQRADFIMCTQVQNLKAQNRQRARENYERRFQTYRILSLEVTPELEHLALDILNRELQRNKLRKCSKLPLSK